MWYLVACSLGMLSALFLGLGLALTVEIGEERWSQLILINVIAGISLPLCSFWLCRHFWPQYKTWAMQSVVWAGCIVMLSPVMGMIYIESLQTFVPRSVGMILLCFFLTLLFSVLSFLGSFWFRKSLTSEDSH